MENLTAGDINEDKPSFVEKPAALKLALLLLGVIGLLSLVAADAASLRGAFEAFLAVAALAGMLITYCHARAIHPAVQAMIDEDVQEAVLAEEQRNEDNC